jgi:putative hydrolase of the HAD superfamily
MKYQAVIFDLFGTLIPSFSEREYQEKVKEIASIMQASPHDFWKMWSATLKESMLGAIPSLEAKIIRICQKLGIRTEASKIREAEDMFYEYEAKYMLPRPEASEVILQLKTTGIKTGLISDCSSEGPELWKKTALAPFIDVSIFSCSVGLQKPDPRIYHLALQQLDVKAQDCLYVGDGGSTELTGASRIGLDAVQLRIPGENDPDVFRINKEDWQGTIITSLKEVLILIQE